MPTYSLLITIATMAMPLAISKLVAEKNERSIKIISSSVVIMIVINALIMIIMFLTSKYIAFNLLKNKEAYILLIACTITLPFISLSSIIKGYFFGKQQMIPYAISNSLEQVVRLVCIILFLPKFMKHGVLVGLVAFILLSIISEVSSIIIFLFFLPKKVVIQKKDLKPQFQTIKNVLNVSVPTVSSRLIGNIGFFFEPIILTNVLLHIGYSNAFILKEYGAYNTYSLGLLTMPGFFVGAISNSLIPEISKYKEQKNSKMVKRRFNQALLYSFILGLLFTIPIYLFRDKLLFILYHTTSGADYIKVLSPFFVLFYLESPIISALQGLGLSKYTMKITFLGVILKNIVLAIFSLFHIGIYGLIISEITNIIFVVLTNMVKIKKVISNL
jgi:stage V sporulation protein B